MLSKNKRGLTGGALSGGALIVSMGVAAALLGGLGATTTAAPAAAASAPTALLEDALSVDGSHSSVIYRISHLGVANFYGRFGKIDGTFAMDPANPSSATFDVTIDAASIDSNNAQRDQHLKSPDFFNVKQFPSITFKSKDVRKVGSDFEIAGEMTLLGMTKPVTAKLVHTGSGDKGGRFGYRSGCEATFTFKRSDFGMNYGIKDGVLGDEVMVIVAIEGTRK